MTVTLLPETEQQIRQLMESGQYQDANSVVAEGLELLRQREEFLALRAEINIGVEQYKRGEFVEMNDDFRSRVLQKAIERRQLRSPVRDGVKS